MDYKGYFIETVDNYGTDAYMVQFCGDEIIFDTEEEAMLFIDEIQ